MRDKRVRMPYLEDRLPCDSVLYGDIGAAHAAASSADATGNQHKANRARKRERQLQHLLHVAEHRTCRVCGLRLKTGTDRKAHELINHAEEMVSYTAEDDPDVLLIAPIIAHKLWGQKTADGLSGGQRRQVRDFAHAVVKELRDAGRLPTVSK